MKLSDRVQANTHLLVVWEAATHRLAEIETDLQRRFEQLYKIRVRWSEAHVHENMGRFYGKKLPDIAEKVAHCGAGEFVVYFLDDPVPSWAVLETSSGPQLVNRNMFEAKQLYREMTGGGHRVHATNNSPETLRDAVLLLGNELPRPEDFESAIHRDLTGCRGWSSLTEMFAVVNLCAKYVVLRNFDTLPEEHHTELHGDIDVLCVNRDEFAQLTNARRVFPQAYRRHYMVNVGGEDVAFDIRDVNENYYCPRWSRDLIRRRVARPGIYTPDQQDYLYSLAYHALLHKAFLPADYGVKLAALFDSADQMDPVSNHLGYIAEALELYMSTNGYRFVRPLDWSVYFNYRNSPKAYFPLLRFIHSPPTTLKHFKRELRALLPALYRQYVKTTVSRLKKMFASKHEQ